MLAELKAEYFIVKEYPRLVKENPRHIKRIISLYLLSLLGLTNAHIIRSSYYPMRRIDNWLDLDVERRPDHIISVISIRQRLANCTLDIGSELEFILDHALDKLEQRARPEDDPRQDFLLAIDAMLVDAQRAQSRQVLTSEELRAYYHATFDPIMNLFLLGLNSRFRIGDLPALSYGQGAVYSARDIRMDWELGFINIPGETLLEASLTNQSMVEDVCRNPVVRDWIKVDLGLTRANLLETEKTLASSGERSVHLACAYGLIRPMIKIINNVTQQIF